jgi:hypothetical protein
MMLNSIQIQIQRPDAEGAEVAQKTQKREGRILEEHDVDLRI